MRVLYMWSDITYLSSSVQKCYKATILRGDLFVASLDFQFFLSNHYARREVPPVGQDSQIVGAGSEAA